MTPDVARANATDAGHEPWLLVLPLSLAGFVLIGGMLTSLSVLVSAMQGRLGWSAAQAGAGPVALLLGMSVGNLIVGPAMRRIGTGGTFAAGCALAGAGWIGGGYADTLVWFATAMGLAGLGAGAATIVPAIALLSQAFAANRGMAIALFIGSCALASSTVPILTGWLVEAAGSRTTFLIAGIAALALVPVMIRMLPSTRVTPQVVASSTEAGVMREPIFWLLTGILTLSQVCMNGVLFSIVAYFKAEGLATADAVALYSLTNFMSLPGLIVGGGLSDRLPARTLLPVILVVQAIGTLALLGMNGADAAGISAAAAFVVLWGGVAGLPAQAGSLALKEIAGARDFTMPLAVMFTLNGLLGAFAPGLTGWLQDASGDLRFAFGLFGAMLLLAALASLWCRPPGNPAAPDAGAHEG